MEVLRTKPVEQSIGDTEMEERRLRKDLSALDLTAFYGHRRSRLAAERAPETVGAGREAR